MAEYGTGFDADVPEADLLEQRQSIDESTLAEELSTDAATPALAADDTSFAEADESDRLEQATPVSGDETDDYPHHDR